MTSLSKVAEIKLSFKPHYNPMERPCVSSSKDAYNVLKVNWDMELIQYLEQFKVLLLNRSNRVIGLCNVSQGGISATYVDLKVIFALALKSGASSMILCHNHPSGNLKPSPEDLAVNKKIQEAAKLFDISLYDHIIITALGYYSYADNGLL